MAYKYFGSEDAMGKVLRGDNLWDFTVTGIMRNIPKNSHMRPDMIISYFHQDSHWHLQP